MTLEEKAEKYARKTKKVDWEGFDVDKEARKEGYIAGATENGIIWHDLRKNPDDLPDSNRTVFAVARVGGNRQYPYLAQYWKGSKVEWCCWMNNMQRELVEPDAWCEIPEFEEA